MLNKTKHLGSFHNYQDAVDARKKAELEYGFTCDENVGEYDKGAEPKMVSGYILKILFRDGHTEEHYCDSYQTADGLLSYNIYFGVNSGLHCIPYDLIREFTVER